jgi:hypothetical protein
MAPLREGLWGSKKTAGSTPDNTVCFTLDNDGRALGRAVRLECWLSLPSYIAGCGISSGSRSNMVPTPTHTPALGAPCAGGAPSVAFRLSPRRRHPEVPAACAAGRGFRSSIPGLHLPLSTLRRRPCERLRMTRGRCGSLLLQRMKLPFTTPCRFDRRTEKTRNGI